MSLGRSARAAGIYAAGKFASYGFNLATLPILTRLLAPSDFGVIALAGLFPAIAVSVFTCGLGTSAQRYYFEYRRDPAKLHDFYVTCQLFLFASLAVFAAMVWPLRDMLARLVMSDASYGRALYWASIAGYAGQIMNFYAVTWQNMEEPRLAAGFPFLQAALTASLGLAFVWFGKLTYMGPIYGALVSSALTCAAACWLFNRGVSGKADAAILKENVVYGLQVVPKSFSGFINRFFDKFMLNNMLSMGTVGVYNIGQSIGNCVSVLMNTVWSALQPACYREVFDNGEPGAREAGRLFGIFAYFALAPVLGGALFAQELVMLIAPPAYYQAIDAMVIILAGVIPSTFGMFSGAQFAYAKKPYWIFPLTVAGTLANVAANVALIPRLGLTGAALSSCLSTWVLHGLCAGVGQKIYPIGYQWPRLILMHGVVLAAALFAVLSRRCGLAWPAVYAGKAACLALYAAVGARSGIITRQRLRELAGLWT